MAYIIPNPIYDVVFKYLLEDEEVAKCFIGIIIGKTILEIHLLPQEKTYLMQEGIRVQRLDFVALVKEEEGSSKVLIELQKSTNALHADLMRFRGYLAKQYTLDDLPIITIYLLGFVLDERLPATIYVSRGYFNLSTKEKIDLKSDFIEKLTHDCYVIQIPLLKRPLRSKIDYILSIFDQQRVYSVDKEGRKYLVYDEEPLDKDVELLIRRLTYANSDKEIREQLEDAEYMERYYQEAFGKKEMRIVELEGNIVMKDEELKHKDEELKHKDEELKHKDEELKHKDEELKHKDEELKHKDEELKHKDEELKQEKVQVAKKLLGSGIAPFKIMEILQVDESFMKKHGLME